MPTIHEVEDDDNENEDGTSNYSDSDGDSLDVSARLMDHLD